MEDDVGTRQNEEAASHSISFNRLLILSLQGNFLAVHYIDYISTYKILV